MRYQLSRLGKSHSEGKTRWDLTNGLMSPDLEDGHVGAVFWPVTVLGVSERTLPLEYRINQVAHIPSYGPSASVVDIRSVGADEGGTYQHHSPVRGCFGVTMEVGETEWGLYASFQYFEPNMRLSLVGSGLVGLKSLWHQSAPVSPTSSNPRGQDSGFLQIRGGIWGARTPDVVWYSGNVVISRLADNFKGTRDSFTPRDMKGRM